MCTQLLWSDGAVAGQIRIGGAASKIPLIGFELFHQLLCLNFLDLIFESKCLRVSPGTSPQFLSSKHPPWHPGTQTIRWIWVSAVVPICLCFATVSEPSPPVNGRSSSSLLNVSEGNRPKLPTFLMPSCRHLSSSVRVMGSVSSRYVLCFRLPVSHQCFIGWILCVESLICRIYRVSVASSELQCAVAKPELSHPCFACPPIGILWDGLWCLRLFSGC
ncbi:hypothetical protein HID58_005381 [Brassica napus]|uniref:Uncharacterized protein n=1 Tax=Brassica napus TaxID=3708 RepID=A0ABQ8E8H3_BRANA|nr:hypothetical protein HID58_005381 [Brassica napus]